MYCSVLVRPVRARRTRRMTEKSLVAARRVPRMEILSLNRTNCLRSKFADFAITVFAVTSNCFTVLFPLSETTG